MTTAITPAPRAVATERGLRFRVEYYEREYDRYEAIADRLLEERRAVDKRIADANRTITWASGMLEKAQTELDEYLAEREEVEV